MGIGVNIIVILPTLLDLVGSCGMTVVGLVINWDWKVTLLPQCIVCIAQTAGTTQLFGGIAIG